MGERRSFLLISTCLLFLINIFLITAEEFYLARMQVVRDSSSTAAISTEEEEAKLSLLFQQEMINRSNKQLSFRPLESLPKEEVAAWKTKAVTSTLDALALCFFANIDNIVFGSILIDQNNIYEADIQVYSRVENKIIYEVVYSGFVADEKAYFAEIGTRLFENVQKISLNKAQAAENENQATATTVQADSSGQQNSEPVSEVQVNSGPENAREKETIADTRLEKRGTEQVTLEQPVTELSFNAPEVKNKLDTGVPEILMENWLPQTDEKNTPRLNEQAPVDNNKPLLIYLSGGYFIPIIDEWKEKIMPCVSMEQGVKLPTPWLETENFDLIFQWGFFFNYTFALNKSTNLYYTHFHSLTTKAAAELDFEFWNLLSFFIGVGPQYKVNIIDYENLGGHFFTDIPYALGLWGEVGIQFLFGERKGMAVGITNIIDATFFANTYIDYKAHLHFLLRV